MKINSKSAFCLVALGLTAVLVALPACSGTATTATATVTVTTPITVTTTLNTSTQPPTTTTTTTTTTPPLSSTTLPTGGVLNGQDIFLNAVDAAGTHVTATGFVMLSRNIACADCHGTSGHGGNVYMMMAQYQVANISWPSLTGPDFTPPYTVDLVKRAFTQGIDSAGKALDPFMPRWSMSAQDQTDLVSYLQTLK